MAATSVICSLVIDLSHLLSPAACSKLTFADGQGWAPLVSENIQADAAVRVDVGVVDTSSEVDLRRLEWVVCGEMDR